MLKPNQITKTFDGFVYITFQVYEPTEQIILHVNNLTIHSVNLKNHLNQSVAIRSYEIVADKRELLLIILDDELAKESHTLFILFSGNMDKKLVGLYSSNLGHHG